MDRCVRSDSASSHSLHRSEAVCKLQASHENRMVQLRFKATFNGDPFDPKKWEHRIIELVKSRLEQKLASSPQISPVELAQITIDFREEKGKVRYSIKGPADIAIGSALYSLNRRALALCSMGARTTKSLPLCRETERAPTFLFWAVSISAELGFA